jgi:nicotinamide-nucleotide amidase
MNIELITTGEEVLSGQITDTNSPWVGQLLEQNGMPLTRKLTVGDRADDLETAFLERAECADVVIVNGGLGPTVDDLSAEIAARALDEPLVRFEAWVQRLEVWSAKWGRPLCPENLKQAMLPESATIIDNPVGTACGFHVELKGAHYYFTPGVPNEFKRMMEHEVIPDIKKRFKITTVCKLHRLHCFGIGESRLDGLLKDIVMPSGVTLGFRSHIPEVEIKVMGRSDDAEQLDKDMATVAQGIRARTGANIIYEGNTTLTRAIQDQMIQNQYTLAVAESCTGGMIGDMLVSNSGSSGYFNRGFVTYTNEAKVQMLDVPTQTLQEFGAVSAETAEAMVRGAKRAAGTSHALSVTGVAGPDGGTDEKPVGTVAFGLATPEGVFVQVLKAPDIGRTRVRAISATVALDMLRRSLAGLSPFGDYDSTRGSIRLEQMV